MGALQILLVVVGVFLGAFWAVVLLKFWETKRIIVSIETQGKKRDDIDEHKPGEPLLKP